MAAMLVNGSGQNE